MTSAKMGLEVPVAVAEEEVAEEVVVVVVVDLELLARAVAQLLAGEDWAVVAAVAGAAVAVAQGGLVAAGAEAEPGVAEEELAAATEVARHSYPLTPSTSPAER